MRVDPDENIFAFSFDVVGAEVFYRVPAHRFTRREMKPRLVERALDFISLDKTISKTSELVSADVVNGEELVAISAQRDLNLGDRDQGRDIVFNITCFGGKMPTVNGRSNQIGLAYDRKRVLTLRWVYLVRLSPTYLSPDTQISYTSICTLSM